MKLILNESQYNRIFNTKKKKMVITESQYKRLLVEANVSNSLLAIEKSDTIKLVTKSGDKLHFKVVAKNGNEIMMINCNDGVYKNAYFYINGSSYSNGNLSYRIAQNKDIDDKNPWETLKSGSDIWRKSTFKDLAEFKIYSDGGEGLTCNLSDSAKEKFGIDLETGSKIEPENKEADSDEEKPKVSMDRQIYNSLSRLYEGYKYKLMLVEPDVDKDGKVKLTDFGSIVINVVKRQGNRIEFEVDEVDGAGGEIYSDMVGKLVSFVLDKKNIDVPELDTDKMVFDMKVTLFTDETDDEKNRVTEEQVIANISAVSKGVKADSVEDDSDEDTFSNLSTDKMEELIKRLVTDNEYLQKAIYTRPNKLLQLIGLSRGAGIIPAEGRLAKWGISVADKSKNAIDNARFPINRKFMSSFMSFDIRDKSLSGGLNLNSDFQIKSMKDNPNVDNKKFGTNFGKNIKLEEEFKYIIYLKKELEERDDFYVYEVQVFYKESQNRAGKEVGTGRLKILKEEK